MGSVLTLYSIAYTLALPLVFLQLWFKGRRNPDYRRRWGERLGFGAPLAKAPRIWLHCVSVGEVEAATPLVPALLARYPGYRLLVTCTTPTGSDRIRQRFGDRVEHCYLPCDAPGPVRRFLDRARPTVALIMETELWPTLLRACARRDLPVIVLNARLSTRSFGRYRRVAAILHPVFADLTIAARGPADAAHFRRLGARDVAVMGDIKLDIIRRPRGDGEAPLLPSSRRAWVAASTHEGEEALVLAAHETVRRSLPDALLVLVPRHPERFDAVAALLATRAEAFLRFSEVRALPAVAAALADERIAVLLVDTMGDLLRCYDAAPVAFVGGSLVEHGGHNPYEAAVHDCAVITGPHTFNFERAFTDLAQAGAALRIADAATLADAVLALLRDPRQRGAMIAAGHDVLARGQGATARALALVDAAVDRRGAGTPRD